MRGITCQDGSSLAVVPVAARDRGGAAYEITLELRRDGAVFGAVGERCGHRIAALAERVAAARADGSPQSGRWPDPDDRFPEPGGGLPADAPGDEPELFAFRHRERADGAGTGELRCTLRTTARWVGPGGRDGRWRIARRAVVEAWGAGGRGVRAVLTSGELAGFLAEVLAEAERDRSSRRLTGRR
ncbi:hypothetical protein [Actinomadura flavalba]|uniref:hypothetical protein n=1 Tax=Actinomadura flavalba TaxID=1120938 RepID=UPI000372EABE|nr:hypothetical protein [Actinomadura flavalba]